MWFCAPCELLFPSVRRSDPPAASATIFFFVCHLAEALSRPASYVLPGSLASLYGQTTHMSHVHLTSAAHELVGIPSHMHGSLVEEICLRSSESRTGDEYAEQIAGAYDFSQRYDHPVDGDMHSFHVLNMSSHSELSAGLLCRDGWSHRSY